MLMDHQEKEPTSKAPNSRKHHLVLFRQALLSQEVVAPHAKAAGHEIGRHSNASCNEAGKGSPPLATRHVPNTASHPSRPQNHRPTHGIALMCAVKGSSGFAASR